ALPRCQPGAAWAPIALQTAQRAQGRGRALSRPAEPLLRRFVSPGGGVGNESRAAAIWALGFIHEKAAPPDLVQELIGRMAAMRNLDPEDGRVGQMSAASLGRMRARAAEDTLRAFYTGALSHDTISNVSGWALQQRSEERRVGKECRGGGGPRGWIRKH